MPIENFRATSSDLETAEPDAPVVKRRVNALDSEQAVRRFKQLQGWYAEEREIQSVNRYQMALDEDFKDNLQWSDEEIQELLDRYQAPLVYNLIHGAIKWVTGTEKRTRVDFKVLPRERGDIQGAHVKTQLLKYVSDVNRAAWHRSHAFEDAVTAGVGWVEDGIRSDPTEEPLFSGYEHWRNVFYDSFNRTHEEARSRYLFRDRVLDLDVAIAMFHNRRSLLESAASQFDALQADNEDYYLGQRLTTPEEEGWTRARTTFTSGFQYIDSTRERVKLTEAWYRVPARMKVMIARDSDLTLLHGQQFDPRDELHRYAEQNGAITLADTMRMQVRVATFCDEGLLQDMESPYRHNRFGLTPIWGYRRKRDGAPYGLVRLMRDPQSDLNKRRSKSIFMLSTVGVVMDEDPDADIEEIRDEAARPDYVLVKKPGRDLDVQRHIEVAQAHHQMEMSDAQYIRETSGVTSENLGLDSNAQSGKAVIAKQQQGSLTTQDLFDNLRFAVQIQGENQLSLIEQYYTDQKVIRIVGADGKDQHLTINEQQDDGEIANDIVRSKADFVVAAADYTETVRMALFEQFMQLLGRLPPEVGLRLLPSALELIDLPMRDKIIAKVREITGEPDTEQPLTEEEAQRQKQRQEAMAKQAQMQEQAQQLALEQQAAEVAKLQAQAAREQAQADQIMAELQGMLEGAGTEREKELIKQLQKAQETIWKERQAALMKDIAQQTEIGVAKVKLANRDKEIEKNAETALLSKSLDLGSQEKRHAQQLDMQRETAKHATETDAEVKREGIKTQARTQKEIASKNAETKRETDREKLKSDERVGMAGVKAKAASPAKAASGGAKTSSSSKEVTASPASAVIGELHVHIPPGAMGQQDKPRKKKGGKTMTIEKSGGKLIVKTQESDE